MIIFSIVRYTNVFDLPYYLHIQLNFHIFSSGISTLTTLSTFTGATVCTGATVGIAVGVTCTIIIMFLVGALVAVLLYHCISKHRLQLKLVSSSFQQQQTGLNHEEVQAAQEYEVPVTSGAEIEIKENTAYGPVQQIELRENVAYGPAIVQH